MTSMWITVVLLHQVSGKVNEKECVYVKKIKPDTTIPPPPQIGGPCLGEFGIDGKDGCVEIDITP